MNVSLQHSASEAAEILKRRRDARRSLVEWSRLNGFEPALHHRYIIDRLEAAARGDIRRLMILVPPGSAKSTYTSVLFPPWYLANYAGRCILACSYAKDLAASFGRRCRNMVELHSTILRYELRKDSKAADEWETTNGGRYFCAGVGTGIAGHRADLGFIDDYIGTQADADSAPFREEVWNWYWGDFWPRLKPQASQIIIANRRHEDDLVGRLLASEDKRYPWTVIRLPMIAETNDPIGRQPGERLWPEWFTEEQVDLARAKPRIWAGLYQQRPAPEDGNYFHAKDLIGYVPSELPKELHYYGAGDFAVSEEKGSDHTCFGIGGVDPNGILWILPDIYWDKDKIEAPDVKIERILDLCTRTNPEIIWAEQGHISKSLKPFIRRRMIERNKFFFIDEVNPSKDKEVRCQSFRARTSQGMVRFPTFAPWWADALHDMLVFPGGTHDDIIDMFGHLGNGIDTMSIPSVPKPKPAATLPVWQPTIGWLRALNAQREREAQALELDM